MRIHINGIDAKNVTQLSRLQYSQPDQGGLQNFPAVILDRHSGITGMTIWARAGEESSLAGECYSVYIGAFCPISDQVMLLVDVNHDYASVSMSGQVPDLIPVSYRNKMKGSIIIQNDVWIGYGVTILSGITIHNGAVIAANSTVTKDIPPYAIVAGNPAKVIKYRFSQDIIDGLQRIQWWYWDDTTIKKRSYWFQRSPEEFIKKFDVSMGGGQISSLQGLHDEQLSGIPRKNRYLVFSDTNDPYSVLFKIIKAFSETRSEHDWLVVAITNNDKLETQIQSIYKFAEGIDTKCGLYVRCTNKQEIPALISECGTLITSRVLDLVRFTCLADAAGAKIISGVDIPVF